MKIPRISMFIIGLIWVSFFAVVFSSFMANLTSNYGVGFNEDEIETYNKLDEMNTRVESYQEETDLTENTGLTDIIGGYFSKAYQALKLTTDSLDIFGTMTEDAFTNENLNLGTTGTALKTAIIATVTILIFVGVLLSAIVKKDL